MTPSEQLRDLYLAQRELANLSPTTLAGYLYTINQFLMFPGTPADPADWSVEHVEFWLLAIHRRGLKPSSLAHFRREIRAWLSWLWKRKRIPLDISAELEPVKVPKSLGRRISKEDFAAMLLAARTGKHRPLRDAAMLQLLWSTGMRRGEMSLLDITDVDFRTKTIHLRAETTKAKEERVVPFDNMASVALQEYRQTTRECPLVASGPLFYGYKGRRWSKDAMRQAIESIAHRAQLGHLQSSHDFRRSFVSRVRLAGLDSLHVKAIVGHSSDDMVELYSGAAEGEAAVRAYRRLG